MEEQRHNLQLDQADALTWALFHVRELFFLALARDHFCSFFASAEMDSGSSSMHLKACCYDGQTAADDPFWAPF